MRSNGTKPSVRCSAELPYANRQGWQIVETYHDTISGTLTGKAIHPKQHQVEFPGPRIEKHPLEGRPFRCPTCLVVYISGCNRPALVHRAAECKLLKAFFKCWDREAQRCQ